MTAQARSPRASAQPAAVPNAASANSVASAIPTRKRRKPASSSHNLTLDLRDAVVNKLESMKARDLRMIDVRERTSVTDFLVIASGTSTRHVKAMADDVVEAAKALTVPPIGVEGERDAEWVLVDLGDVIVHLMLPRTREFYGLERLWGVDVPSAEAAAASI